jgi:chromate reductase
MATIKVLAFGGSLRRESFNQKLVRIAADGAAAAGADVTVVSLADYRLPVFDEDLEKEKGLPPEAIALKKLFNESHALLIASPEYNSSLTAALKNALDWVSRPAPGETTMSGFAQKTAAIMAASPGALGGLRGLVHLRAILGSIGVLLLPDQIAVMKAHEAFDASGALKDKAQDQKVRDLGKKLAQTAARLHG